MEYFYVANSNPAPFVSDTSENFIQAHDEDEAVEKVLQTYRHPSGLYSLSIWVSADDRHKDKKPLRTWLSPKAANKARKS